MELDITNQLVKVFMIKHKNDTWFPVIRDPASRLSLNKDKVLKVLRQTSMNIVGKENLQNEKIQKKSNIKKII